MKAAGVDHCAFPEVETLSSKLVSFTPISESDIYKLVSRTPAKTCALDSIPTALLKKHVGVLFNNLSG